MDLQDKLLELWREISATMILMTHDVEEAVYLGDRIVIMTPRPGKINQIIGVKLRRPRYRNGSDFIQMRNAILEALHLCGRQREPECFL